MSAADETQPLGADHSQHPLNQWLIDHGDTIIIKVDLDSLSSFRAFAQIYLSMLEEDVEETDETRRDAEKFKRFLKDSERYDDGQVFVAVDDLLVVLHLLDYVMESKTLETLYSDIGSLGFSAAAHAALSERALSCVAVMKSCCEPPKEDSEMEEQTLPSSEVKNTTVGFRCTKEQKLILSDAAKQDGMKLAEWILSVALREARSRQPTAAPALQFDSVESVASPVEPTPESSSDVRG